MEWTYTFMQTGLYGVNINMQRKRDIMQHVFSTNLLVIWERDCRIIHFINKLFLISSVSLLFKTALLKNNQKVVTTKITEWHLKQWCEATKKTIIHSFITCLHRLPTLLSSSYLYIHIIYDYATCDTVLLLRNRF